MHSALITFAMAVNYPVFPTFARRANVVKHDAARAISIHKNRARPHEADKCRPTAGMVREECADPRSRSEAKARSGKPLVVRR